MGSIREKISAAAHDFWPDKAYPIPITRHWYGKPCIDPRSIPTFDPMLGFPNGRKERGRMASLILDVLRLRLVI